MTVSREKSAAAIERLSEYFKSKGGACTPVSHVRLEYPEVDPQDAFYEAVIGAFSPNRVEDGMIYLDIEEFEGPEGLKELEALIRLCDEFHDEQRSGRALTP